MTLRPIRLVRVRQNNLKNVTVEFPARELSVITGLSGSGKSSLAFDTLYAEGQRRYIESLSTYTRQFLEKMPKPDLDSIENIPPAIALQQKNHVVGSRSTVGTQTEIVDYLRVLFAKVGKVACTHCGGAVRKVDPETILDWAADWLPGRRALILAPLGTPEAEPETKAAVKQKKATGKAKPTARGTKARPAVQIQTLLQIIREQGFTRLVWRKGKSSELLDLEELGGKLPPKIDQTAINAGQLLVVIDRVRISETPDTETRGRLLDSIDQALAIGRGKILFHDPDGDKNTFHELKSGFNCIQCGFPHRFPEPHLFSFNSPLGACPKCSGFGFTLDLDEALIVPDPSKTLKNGAIDPFSKPSATEWQKGLFRFAERHGISVGKRYRELTASERRLLWNGDPEDSTFPGIAACFEELKRWKYKLHVRVFIRRYQSQNLCTVCNGSRLKPEALSVTIGGRNISEVLASSMLDALDWFQSLKLTPREQKIAQEVLYQVERRLSFLKDVGVGYLTLSRQTRTLSGGEFQRINLATQLGNGLCGTLYVLDEPSIGLHAADTDRLIGILERLRDQGNTVVVVEHDLEVMRRANWLVELGPGAGRRGGELIAQGNAKTLIATPGSLTGKYLSGAFTLSRSRPPRPPARRALKITGCRENNLKNLDVDFPLDRFVVVTGVSGSGKSTLVHRTVFEALSKLFYRSTEVPGHYDRIYGAEQLSGIVLLDQTSIGKSSRSNPATYIKAWDEIRRLYASQVVSLRRGYMPQHFSFNVDGGRCPVCKGEGEVTLDMHFMAEVKLPCEECDGKRFKKSILDVSYRGKDINQLLHTTIDDAYELFRDHSILIRKLGILREVGLGYLQLGQSATTLSGGESQRLKIAASLDDRSAENLLYIFDEPTTGLHLEDIKKLLGVVQDLVDAKNSVIMIEHHMDVIAQADWIIDLGPGGGTAGGEMVAAGTPEQLLRNPASVTGQMLEKQGYRSRLITGSPD
ncbi:MAG TPA: excinuclease ABC subunit A [Bdellovibrionales bacterium]|nr:MAG: excinuclease ABC subunit A [Bdellovibrionales bacterium GWB1_52_6]OFZ06327.1 MAG: excinuclease ABC subunit A [Bdellovibrionales bacterium GWA1_52_35]OFZ39724.1 MAG: excinuclease ABC subunit A [Bdellovibrionales bacterium GWC1_52_8]HAR42369.1 excinuclease ABC subunit A [Bdellovibrionales bacterium]HCM40078.1 excinuclease ABC subunit A [Bdellovibrionales bacterium]